MNLKTILTIAVIIGCWYFDEWIILIGIVIINLVVILVHQPLRDYYARCEVLKMSAWDRAIKMPDDLVTHMEKPFIKHFPTVVGIVNLVVTIYIAYLAFQIN